MLQGASTVKCTEKNALVYWNRNFFGQMHKINSQVLFELDLSFHDTLYYCVSYSNREYQDKILKACH